MKITSTLNKSIIIAAMTVAIANFAASAQAADKMDKEKCYGVVKAGKNDCKGKNNSCAGMSTQDGEGFVVVPQGLCAKLVGGSTASE